MTTTSYKMNRHSLAYFFLVAFTGTILLVGCKKTDKPNNHHNDVSAHTSDVVDKWMTMQIRLMRNTTGVPNQAFSRPYVYAGIASLESISMGLPANQKWSGRWNGLTGLPVADHSKSYFYPANVNAALAAINKAFFPNASIADKAAIDSLENALSQHFLTTQSQALVDFSAQYGKAVATAVFNWAETDGHKNASAPYSPPVGQGLWVPTAPALANPSTPYWGNNRTVIVGSIANTQPAAPIAYSIQSGSPFFEMVKQVYDASQNLTDDQKAMAMFWRDVPGVTSPGHWLSIVQQAMRNTEASLDRAVLAYALTGAAINDGLISVWQTKYGYSLVRPITYIRDIMNHGGWTSYLTTPPHPEYSSAHAVLSTAAGEVMEKLFGNVGSFTDHTYDYLGFAARTYPSYRAIGKEAGQSRLYAGIHYQQSIDAGVIQGKKVAANIFSPATLK